MPSPESNPLEPAPPDAPAWLSPVDALLDCAPPASFRPAATERKGVGVRYGFRTGSLGLLIQRETGSEIVEARNITPLPGSVSWLVGMMNLRGTPVPVFDLCAALNVTRHEALQKPWVLVLDSGVHAAGLLIDGKPEALADLTPAPTLGSVPELLRELAPQSWTAEGAMWVDLDHRRLLSALNQDSVV